MPEKFDSRKDAAQSVERLDERHIAIIGQGHFGSALSERLRAIAPPGVALEPVRTREENNAAAFRSDLTIIIVRPQQVEETLARIRPHLHLDGQVLSFAANIPSRADTSLKRIAADASRPAARMMSDPWFNMSAYALGEGFSKQGYEFLFNRLSAIKPVQLENDAALDRFALLMAQLVVAALMERAGEGIAAAEHAQFVAAQKVFKDVPFSLGGVHTGNDPRAALQQMATPGGITERIRDTLRARPRIQPADLLLYVERSIQR